MARYGICSQCGTRGTAKRVTPGNFLIELALWAFFLVPGLIYSVWRVSARRSACRTCGAIDSLVPLGSPRGRQLAAEFAPAPRPSAPPPAEPSPRPATGDPWLD